MSENYDDIPEEFWGDPKRIWQAQISGEKNFDDYSFMGALNDLQSISIYAPQPDGFKKPARQSQNGRIGAAAHEDNGQGLYGQWSAGKRG